MKKRIGYICLFVSFLLIGCTSLSRRVEKNMMTQVVAVSPMRYHMLLPMTALMDGKLYYLEEGLGWNTGTRATQISDFYYKFTEKGQILMDGFEEERVVVSTSRNLQPGDPVNPLQERETGQDQYLVIYLGGMPKQLNLPEGAVLRKQAEDVLLLDVEEVSLPFLENEAKTQLLSIQGRQWQIYSKRDLEGFARSLPRLALAAVFAAIPPVLFLLGAVLPPRKKDLMLRLHIPVGIAGLAGFIGLIFSIQLPFSLMPEDMIFQWDHYTVQLQTVLDALDQLGEPGFASLLTQCQTAALWILAAGGIVLAALVVGSAVLYKRSE